MSKKYSMRNKVKGYLVSQMKSGQLIPGESISLAKVARNLNLSVTPIREALTQLEESKIVMAIPNRGFVIPKLSDKDAIQVYELVANLEAMALEKSQFNKIIISQLKNIQSVFETIKDPLKRIVTDMNFHELLTKSYDNEIFQNILSNLKIRIFFYEKNFMDDWSFHDSSNDQHTEIINNIESGNLILAASILKDNWLQALDYIEKLK